MTEPTQAPAADDAKKRAREKVDKLLAQAPCKSSGSIRSGGQTLQYTAVAEFIPIVAGGIDEKRGDLEAAVFTTAYFLDDAPPATRPVCFAFNGGPGSASIWLHLGALGPKRVVIREDGTMPPPPYTVTDNQQSWFEHFDLVFIDPPHTGYSITASEEARKKMLSVDGDVTRWPSASAPGSDGTGAGVRRSTSPAKATARRAARRSPTSCRTSASRSRGLILVSCAMDLQSLIFAPRNDLPYALFLPAFAGARAISTAAQGAPRRSPRPMPARQPRTSCGGLPGGSARRRAPAEAAQPPRRASASRS